jgi:hypothetical protein
MWAPPVCLRTMARDAVIPRLQRRHEQRECECRGWESNPHAPYGTRDFKSRASASFATPAHSGVYSGRCTDPRPQIRRRPAPGRSSGDVKAPATTRSSRAVMFLTSSSSCLRVFVASSSPLRTRDPPLHSFTYRSTKPTDIAVDTLGTMLSSVAARDSPPT